MKRLTSTKYRDQDVEAVRKAFRVLANAAADMTGNLQIIVLDHATDTVWGEITNINTVAEWRDGKKLVPEEWPSVHDARPIPRSSRRQRPRWHGANEPRSTRSRSAGGSGGHPRVPHDGVTANATLKAIVERYGFLGLGNA